MMRAFPHSIRLTSLGVAGALLVGGYCAPQANAAESHSPLVATTQARSIVAQELLLAQQDQVASLSDEDARAVSRQVSEAVSRIPASALESEAAWQEWRQSVLNGSAAGVNLRVSWGDAANCAKGILIALVTAATGLAVAKKLITLAKNVWNLYKVLKRAQQLYNLYRNAGASSSSAVRSAIYDAFKEYGGQELADFALQLFFGVSSGTVAACVAAVKS